MFNKSDDLERLISLYLRLNGYFSDGFIVHSEKKGNVLTEIDLIGVRFPNHSEHERQEPVSPILAPPMDKTDIIICEVKSGTNKPNFNAALTKDGYRIPVIIRRIGILPEKLVPDVSMRLYKEIISFSEGEKSKVVVDDVHPDIQFRCILFSPELMEDDETYINGTEIMNYIFRCLCPVKNRSKCSTKYDLGLWGSQYADLVTYFKQRQGKGPGTANELCNALINSRRAVLQK